MFTGPPFTVSLERHAFLPVMVVSLGLMMLNCCGHGIVSLLWPVMFSTGLGQVVSDFSWSEMWSFHCVRAGGEKPVKIHCLCTICI